MKTTWLYASMVSAALFTGCIEPNETITPIHLRTEYTTCPIGLETTAPRFTWEYVGEDSTFHPARHEIRIGTSPDRLAPYQEGMVLQPETRYYWNVTVYGEDGRRCNPSETTWFETAKMTADDWQAQWITDSHNADYEPAPMLRKAFTATKPIRSARLYVSAAGYYELFINGTRVGNNFLDPGYTHFDKRNLYVTHDVTALIADGDNVLSAVLGNGWYNEQSVAVWNFHEARWRDRPRLLAELKITYDDGTTETVASDGSWRTACGPYTYNNIYSGDRYDARLEPAGWKTAAFDDSSWETVRTVTAPSPLLTAQEMPGIHATDTLRPRSMTKFSDRLYLYAFDKNLAGLCRLKVKGEAGTHITLKHGELLKGNGRLEQGNINVYYHPVKPGEVFQMDEYTLRGDSTEETWIPSFSYHGFQYVEVESDRPVDLTEESVTALFLHTDIAPVGSFSCSDETLNKIWDATMQAYRSNLHSIPTDCPQREKNGWTADAHIAIDLGLLGFDGIKLYEKWMDDIIDNQREAGDIAGIIPSSGWGYGDFPGPVWDAVMFIIPNALYNYYGTTRSIEKLYPTMERYLDYLKTKERDGYLTYGLSDWVYWKATTNNEYTSTAYYYLDNCLMARFASLLGKDPKPYEEKAETLKALINQKFFHTETATYAEGTQAAQALALYLGLVPNGKEQAVANALHQRVADNNYFLDFGLIGSKTVPAMLAQYGYLEDVMKMMTKREAPSWGYWVETMGYTTLPETWTLSPKFQDASLNHVFMGDISAWMMNRLAGINYDEAHPGFEHILLTPHFAEGLEWAKGSYHSVRGLISSEWKRANGAIELTVTIPTGTSATLKVGGKTIAVAAGTHRYTF